MFKLICNAVGVDWVEVVEWNNESEVLQETGLKESDRLDIIDPVETRWVGRQALIAELINKLQAECRILSLMGITGIGKTSLAARLSVDMELRQTFPILKVVNFDQQPPNFEVVVKCLVGETVAADKELQKQPEKLVMIAVGALRSHPCLLVLDMAEALLSTISDGMHDFLEPAFKQFLEQILKVDRMPSRVVLTSQYRIPTLAEGRYSGSRQEFMDLKGLSESEALDLFQAWDICPEEKELELLKRIIHVYEGHPLALRVIAGDIRSLPFAGDVQAYWKEYGQEIEDVERMQNSSAPKNKGDRPRLDRYSLSLEDLVRQRVESTFKRLYQSSRLAYLMICMISEYRCAVEKKACLIMIEDLCSEEEAKSAFLTLQRRFLLETEQNTDKKTLYRLHSIIRRVALDHLDKLEDE
ncbi:NB-ARC domain-containing protein [Tumidithrix elongata RA019]|uniref:NB-ARC domain-containing protein n=1 Tax=Tumidithrix elongata BACA0141 TaxID=2716417 RepID=A0AAW9PVS1_9CYAN|nr:NB-ARC domain-containing protein [Tumidithrix elongata RA019]